MRAVAGGGILVSAVLNACALGFTSPHDGRYLLASLVAAAPVALAFGLWVDSRPAGALLGLIGVVTFSATLASRAFGSGIPEPLPVAAACVLGVGLAAVAARRARRREVLEGLLLAYAGAAFIFEVTVLLHRL